MDRQLLQQLYQTYGREIYLYLYSLCKNKAQAEDLMQDVFLKALLSLGNDHPNFRAWLYRVAHNLCLNFLQKQGRLLPEASAGSQHAFGKAADPGYEGYEEDVLQKLLQQERNRWLYRSMSKLPILWREVLVLEHFSGLSGKEIAQALNLNPGNVRVIAHRARKALKELLEKEERS